MSIKQIELEESLEPDKKHQRLDSVDKEMEGNVSVKTQFKKFLVNSNSLNFSCH